MFKHMFWGGELCSLPAQMLPAGGVKGEAGDLGHWGSRVLSGG